MPPPGVAVRMCWQARPRSVAPLREWQVDRGLRPRYAEGGALTGVPHSAQNFAVALRSALQLVQCLAMGVPQESQNFAPARTWLWHSGHSMVAAGAAGAAAAGAGAAG